MNVMNDSYKNDFVLIGCLPTRLQNQPRLLVHLLKSSLTSSQRSDRTKLVNKDNPNNCQSIFSGTSEDQNDGGVEKQGVEGTENEDQRSQNSKSFYDAVHFLFWS